MKNKIIFAALCFLLINCENKDFKGVESIKNTSGSYNHISTFCYNGVKYISSGYGLSVVFNKNSKVELCNQK